MELKLLRFISKSFSFAVGPKFASNLLYENGVK